MKNKIFAILLALTSLIFAACATVEESTTASTVTTPTFESTSASTVILNKVPAYPADQTPARSTIVHQSPDGVSMEITLIGYSSESLGESFYFTDGVMRAEVKITNNSAKTIYQTIPYYCHGNGHNHEIGVALSDAQGKLLRNMDIGVCPAMLQSWSLEAGESITFTLSYAAGDYCEPNDADIKLEDAGYPVGIEFYENYPDGACEYTGSISFGYGYGPNHNSPYNPESVSVTIEAKFLKF